VARDEQEHGLRMHLNLGHTFAHGIENSLGYGRLLHGEAVVLGLLAAVELSWRMAPKRANALARYRETIGRVMRRIPYRRIDVDAVLRSMQMDKKRAGAAVRFVVLDKPGRVKVVSGVRRELVISALESALNEYGSIGGRHAAYSHC
ncbi:MAG TPA: hypothetical protein VN285_11235, partial [Candidatus Deferrimicrobium sp.]|nr:hypothetical protein [Candidatus Deferrimicrobium sp.]